MAYSSPTLRGWRSLHIRELLCGLALIAASAVGGAQEPQRDTGPDAQASDAGLLAARQVQGPEAPAPAPETQDAEDVARPTSVAFDADIFGSLLRRRLLCGLALIAASAVGGAQEPQGDTGPEVFRE